MSSDPTSPNLPEAVEEAIFSAAVALADPGEREGFLRLACGGNRTLRERIDRLIQADSVAGRFVAADPFDLSSTRADTAPPQPALKGTAPDSDFRIGRYRLLEKIGEGGMGEVYHAEQEEPVRRRVALKILKLGMDSRLIVARFEAERQALAIMDHPSIARVFDGGVTESGRPYFVMELVRGIPITEFCDLRKLSIRERVELFIPVCEAVQHAHQKGVIHRDLKPSNILVTEPDGRPIPKVIDFGIAKATGIELTDKTLFTLFNQRMGTPAYMSPEQAGLGGLDIDTRSDIYSLGVLLYEMLTGATPFDVRQLHAAGYEAVFKVIREQEPTKPSTRLSSLKHEELTELAARRCEDPRRLPKGLRGDLDWITLKALEKERVRRYESPTGLAADLRRFLNREPVSAAPPAFGYRLSKAVRKHRIALGVTAAFALVLISGTTLSAWQALRATRLARSESEQRRIAVETQAEQRGLLYAADMGLAFQGWELGRARLTRELLDVLRPKDQEDLRGWEWRYLWGACQHGEQALYSVTNHYGLWSCSVSPDGRWLAGGTGDGTIVLWNPSDPKPLKSLGNSAGLINADGVGFSPDSRTLVHSRRYLRDVLVWDTQSASLLLQLTNAFLAQGCALSPNGSWVAAVGGPIYGESGPGELRLWALPEGRLQAEAPLQNTWLVRATFSPRSDRLATAGGKGQVKIWSVPDLEELALLPHDATVFGVSFSPDGHKLATGDSEGSWHIWSQNPTTGSWNRDSSHQAHVGNCDGVQWSPDGTALATGGRDQVVRLWRWAPSGRIERREFKGHSGRITGLAFSPDGQDLFSASQDKTIRRWHISPTTQADGLYPGGVGLGLSMAFSPSGRWLARPGTSNSTEIVEVATWRKLGEVDGRWPAFASDESWLATVITTNQVQFTETGTWRSTRLLQSDIALTGPPAVSRDALRIAFPAADNHILTWILPSAVPGRPIAKVSGSISGLFFGQSGDELIVVHKDDGSLESIDLKGSLSNRVIPTGAESILSAAVAPDGRGFVLGETGPRIRVWFEKTGRVHLLNADAGSMVSVAWSPDGQTLAGGTFEGLIKLWNVRTLREVGTLRGHSSMVTALAFSPDGRHLVSASIEGTTHRWVAPSFAETDARP